MKVKDLRIGNILLYLGYTLDEEGNLFFDGSEEWITITSTDLIDLEQADAFFKPIKLTEGWLLNFGFDKIENNWMCLNLGFATISWERLAGITFTLENESIFLPHIKYIHQLQNFYFALTGEEITIKNLTE